MTTLTVRIPEDLNKLLEEFCEEEERSKSWLLKKALQEKLDDWCDYQTGAKALKQHTKNPKTITHEELIKSLGLSKKEIMDTFVNSSDYK